jgi:hypothetical protein
MYLSGKDLFSNFAFLLAKGAHVSISAAGAINGETIDAAGYNALGFVVNCASYCSGGANGAGDQVELIIQRGLASAAGVSAWSNVDNSQIIHSYYGGYDSTGTTGIFAILTSSTDITATNSAVVYKVGIKMDADHRYYRFKYSNIGDASAMWMAAEAILGTPANWPVNIPV